MEQQPKINNRLKTKISSLSLDKEDLLRFCNILQERANSAADIEVGLFQKNQQTDDEFEKNKKTLRDSFQLKITVTGKNGEELWGSIDDVFNSTNFPEEVKSLYINSESTLRIVHNYYPHNSFTIFLDFTKPRMFDLSFLPGNRTPNESNIEVKGYDATWVNGVFSELKKFIEDRSSRFSFVHGQSVYDILLWLLGFPLSFWVCFRLSSIIEKIFENKSVFAESATYVYAFVATLFVFRVLFHYLRWICPLIEYRSKKNKMIAHRVLFTALSIAWIGQFLYDLIKSIFKT